MPEIEKFSFEKECFKEIRSYTFGYDWPVVYLIEGQGEVYVGETVNVYSRSIQHWKIPERKKLERIHLVTDEEYNKSAALDIESSLIQYMAADGKYKLQNSNKGLLNHNYYDRPKYQAKFQIIWEELKKIGLVQKDLTEIKNSELFKYSPYKALSADQLIVADEILSEIKKKDKGTYLVNGGPGTGKTILAIYLIKRLVEKNKKGDLKVALVISMTALRNTIKAVFKNIKGLKSTMVIGPNEVAKDFYDVLVVDEAHRLRQRKNIVNYNSFDQTNEKLGFGKDGTELDWVVKQSKHQIFFYDKNQNVMPADIGHDKVSRLGAKEFELRTQLRVGRMDINDAQQSNPDDGEKYIKFIEDLFDLKKDLNSDFSLYDFKVYKNIHKMLQDIKDKNTKLKLCRMVAGYAWAWVSKKNPEKHDIEIDGLKLRWNSVNHNWVNSKNAINEVGCIHTVQGYDLNYTGVIIGPELSYDKVKQKIIVHSERYKDINGRKGVDDPKEIEKYVINIYKTLLTRGIKGSYVYIVDEGLREYIMDRVSSNNIK